MNLKLATLAKNLMAFNTPLNKKELKIIYFISTIA